MEGIINVLGHKRFNDAKAVNLRLEIFYLLLEFGNPTLSHCNPAFVNHLV